MDFFKNKKLQQNYGFTLAEVLITLVIIGVIAAFTIPILIREYRKQEYISAFKKGFSVLQQGLQKIAYNNDASSGDYSFLNDTDFIDEFVKVSNVIKRCEPLSSCQVNYVGLNKTVYNPQKSKGIVTNDGMFIFYDSSGDIYGLSDEDTNNVIGRVLIDTNGNKGPNIIGLDFFYLYIVNGKGIVPAGANNTSQCNKNDHGAHCAAKLLKENAINYI